MTMILNDIWHLFNLNIQSSDNTDIDRKQSAINAAQRYLLLRMIQLEKPPSEFLVNPANYPTTLNQNYLTLPANFLAMHKWWRKSGNEQDQLNFTISSGTFAVGDIVTGSPSGAIGTVSLTAVGYVYVSMTSGAFLAGDTISNGAGATATLTSVSLVSNPQYIPGGEQSILTYDELLIRTGQTFFDNTNKADPLLIAVKEPNMYFDQYFSANETDRIKYSYFKQPTNIVVCDLLPVVFLGGGFYVGDIITGGTSNAQAVIITINAGVSFGLLVTFGTFIVGEAVTNSISSTAQVRSLLQVKPAALEWSFKYVDLLVEACGLWWHKLKGSSEVESRSAIVDNMIRMQGITNWNEAIGTWGLG